MTARYRITTNSDGHAVVSPRGVVVEVFAKRGDAMERCAALNGQLARDAAHTQAFYDANSREYIERTKGGRV